MLLFNNLQKRGFQIWQTQPKSLTILAISPQKFKGICDKIFFQKQVCVAFGQFFVKTNSNIGSMVTF
jgi:hypothetical protein